jgi:glycine/D-amino acid oxidase-like deaminating enzyme
MRSDGGRFSSSFVVLRSSFFVLQCRGMSVNRRGFLKSVVAARAAAAIHTPAAAQTRKSADVIVVGAGAFGGWTAFYLRQLGASVRLVDAYGPGNSRATSGDETRGVRSSYGDRGANAELWMSWANRAIDRWTRFDAEWGRQMKVRLFFNTGDLIFRGAPETFTDRTQQLWKKLGIPFQVLKAEDAARQYPSFDLRNVTFALYDPRAGVVRARRACEVVAEAFRQSGGEVLMGYAALGDRTGTRLQNIKTSGPSATLNAETFVFALGPWFPKAFPDLMAARVRTPLGHVHYFGTPPGSERFTFPNLPSFNFPGVTGWPALPDDNRGFRVRLRGSPPTDPDTSDRAFDRSHDVMARGFLAERFPLMANAPLLETRACHYEMSVSGNFIIDRYPGLSNVWVAGGGTAEGFKFGPMVGEYVARRVLGVEDDPVLARAFRLPEL